MSYLGVISLAAYLVAICQGGKISKHFVFWRIFCTFSRCIFNSFDDSFYLDTLELKSYSLVEAGHECGSSDSYLGKFSTIDECAKACYRTNGCHFFIYGYVSKKGKCYWEKIPGAPGDCVRTTATDDCKVDCQDGWERDSYDFWALDSEYR